VIAPELRAFYGFVKSQKCCNCGKYGTHADPIEAAHVRSIVSGKTGELLPRSHKGEAAWGVVALCKPCHAILHSVGEEKFRSSFLPLMWAHVASLVLRFWLEREGEGT
jgi:hypothetical protein